MKRSPTVSTVDPSDAKQILKREKAFFEKTGFTVEQIKNMLLKNPYFDAEHAAFAAEKEYKSSLTKKSP